MTSTTATPSLVLFGSWLLFAGRNIKIIECKWSFWGQRGGWAVLGFGEDRERRNIRWSVRFNNHSQAASTKLIYLRKEKSTLMKLCDMKSSLYGMNPHLSSFSNNSWSHWWEGWPQYSMLHKFSMGQWGFCWYDNSLVVWGGLLDAGSILHIGQVKDLDCKLHPVRFLVHLKLGCNCWLKCIVCNVLFVMRHTCNVGGPFLNHFFCFFPLALIINIHHGIFIPELMRKLSCDTRCAGLFTFLCCLQIVISIEKSYMHSSS